MTVKYITVKGQEHLARTPFYFGIPQHERTMSKREAYEHIAGKTGYTPTSVRAAFMAAAEFLRENQAKGNATQLDKDGRTNVTRVITLKSAAPATRRAV